MTEKKICLRTLELILLVAALISSACTFSDDMPPPENKFQIAERYSIQVCQAKEKLSRADLQELKQLYNVTLDEVLRINHDCRVEKGEELDFSSTTCLNSKIDSCPVKLLKVPIR